MSVIFLPSFILIFEYCLFLAVNTAEELHYPTYSQLKEMLMVKESQEISAEDAYKAEMQEQLKIARHKYLEYEEALVSERHKNIQLSQELANFLKFGSKINSPTNANQEQKNGDNKSQEKMGSTAAALMAAMNKNKLKNEEPIEEQKPAADDGLNKYRKMIKFRMPKDSIINRMRMDKISPAIIEAYEESGNLPGGSTPAKTTTTSGILYSFVLSLYVTRK